MIAVTDGSLSPALLRSPAYVEFLALRACGASATELAAWRASAPTPGGRRARKAILYAAAYGALG